MPGGSCLLVADAQTPRNTCFRAAETPNLRLRRFRYLQGQRKRGFWAASPARRRIQHESLMPGLVDAATFPEADFWPGITCTLSVMCQNRRRVLPSFAAGAYLVEPQVGPIHLAVNSDVETPVRSPVSVRWTEPFTLSESIAATWKVPSLFMS
jgi:hypothetical protein